MKQVIILWLILSLSACKTNNKQANNDNNYIDDTEITVSIGDWEEG